MTRFILISILGIACSAGPTIAQELASGKKAESGSRDTKPENDVPPKPNLRLTKKTKFKFDKRGGLVYKKTDDYQIKCDVYVPEGDGPFPAILAVHGGAWRQGSKFMMLRHAWMMAESGYVVVAINYRHAPEHPFPAQVHDCKTAVRWMRANAKEFKIDAERIGAFGYSAGGHLVSMLGTTDANDGLEGDIDPGHEKFHTRIKAVVAGGAPCEFSWVDDDSQVLRYWLGGSPSEKASVFRTASPTTYISPDDPPFFFFHGDSDLIVPQSSSQKMHQALVENKMSSQHFTATRTGHLGAFSDLSWMRKAIEFFDANLK